jgi:hypothetical protein
MGITPISVPQNIATSLAAAGDRSGVDFNYLLETAMRESSLDPHAKAANSSAVGLFQFLDTTWLEVMKSDGPRLGYQKYADAITENDGVYSINDATLRAEVLKLREDPRVAADLAAAFTRNNGAYLQQKFGRMPSPGELYIAHFLGAHGAERFFSAGLANPDQAAAKLFPRQAAANPSIFYEHGHARTVREVYKTLVAMHSSMPVANPAFTTQQLAAAQSGDTPLPLPAPLQPPGTAPRWPQDAIPSRFGPADMTFTALFSNEAPPAGPIAPRTLLTTPEAPEENSGFFAGLYGP